MNGTDARAFWPLSVLQIWANRATVPIIRTGEACSGSPSVLGTTIANGPGIMWLAICQSNGCHWHRASPNKISADIYAHLHRAGAIGHRVIVVLSGDEESPGPNRGHESRTERNSSGKSPGNIPQLIHRR